LGPEQAWGLDVWHQPPSAELLAGSNAYYYHFYATYLEQLARLLARHESVLVLDLHSYNHRRGGPGAAPDDPAANPDINLGTGTIDRERFGTVADLFVREMSQVTISGAPLDVRENVKFKGGYLARWTHARFSKRVCVLSVEFKKIFMDEWTGELDEGFFAQIKDALWRTVPALLNTLP
jgi:N-formylglutamate amidohydrolase